jgi:glycerophosphoryl diester phosphodiesterase
MVRKRGAHFRLGAILPNPTEAEFGQALALKVIGVGIYYKNLCLRLVEQAHTVGLEVRAWNPDTLREQQAMIALGADGVGTNRPDILMAHLRATGQR